MNHSQRIIYIDCTDTVISRLKTGIQRTVNSILQVAAYRRSGFEAYPVISCIGNYYLFDSGNALFFIQRLSNLFKISRNLLNAVISSIKPESVPPLAGDVKEEPPLTIFTRLLALCRPIMSCLFWGAFQLDGAFVGRKKISIREQDIIFFPDAVWKNNSESAMRSCNAIKILMIYDVIALQSPEFFEATHAHEFKHHLLRILGQVEGFMTISSAEMDNILRITQPLNQHLQFDYNYLGYDFALPELTGSSTICSGISDAYSFEGSVYLMVGTIEPRKNHVFVLNAFRELWQAGKDISLCIIGHLGWKCDELVADIRNDQRFGTRLFLLTNVSDPELAYAYRNCRAVICASHAEGFGLPLVEAMHFRKPVLASDIPVFREIGKEYPLYFSLAGPSGLVSAIERCEEEEGMQYESPVWPVWQDSVETLFSKLLKMAELIDDKRNAAKSGLLPEDCPQNHSVGGTP